LQLFCYSLSADDSTTFRMKVTSEAEHFTDLSKVSVQHLFCFCSLHVPFLYRQSQICYCAVSTEMGLFVILVIITDGRRKERETWEIMHLIPECLLMLSAKMYHFLQSVCYRQRDIFLRHCQLYSHYWYHVFYSHYWYHVLYSHYWYHVFYLLFILLVLLARLLHMCICCW